jgi:hypothetical protein
MSGHNMKSVRNSKTKNLDFLGFFEIFVGRVKN